MDYLRRDRAAQYLLERYGAFTVATLAKLASVGGGPRFRKMGRFPVYTPDDLDAWATSRMSPAVASTAELAQRRSQRASDAGVAIAERGQE
ncbi:MAG: DNA-binding protein [Sphingomonas sp.]|uniref:DNA-binding protein n=1 Tax=Sphingomonas sp. TaxID=28214 RepID=UPI0025D47EB8|nr:DNA-binding protein [Sphingomonas sp.]MBY0282519.1 DNA-binding protein [Sphingomonas sp.]